MTHKAQMNPNEFFTTHLFLFPSNALESLSCAHTETFGSFGSRRHRHWVPRPTKSQCPMNWLHSSSTSLPREDPMGIQGQCFKGTGTPHACVQHWGMPPQKMAILKWKNDGKPLALRGPYLETSLHMGVVKGPNGSPTDLYQLHHPK